VKAVPHRHDPEPADALERFMRAMFTELITALARSTRSEHLSVSELAALHQLDQLGSVRVSDLAERLGAALPAASRVVSRLVETGLVERREDRNDRRAKTLTLSERGHALIDETSRERVVTASRVAAAMPGTVGDTIGTALQRLIDDETKGRRSP
jgi:DNA-binding MarR family transcriptional regulator